MADLRVRPRRCRSKLPLAAVNIDMTDYTRSGFLVSSLQRALTGLVNFATIQASIEADMNRHVILVRYEVEPSISADEKEDLACASTQVISDFPAPWTIDEQYVSPPGATSLALVAYSRCNGLTVKLEHPLPFVPIG